MAGLALARRPGSVEQLSQLLVRALFRLALLRAIAALAGLCLFALTGPATAQEPEPPAPIVAPVDETQVTAEDIAAAAAELAAQTGLDETLRGQISQLHQATLKTVEATAETNAKIAEFDAGIEQASATLKLVQEARDRLLNGLPPKASDFPDLDQLRQALAQSEAELEQEKLKATSLSEEPARRVARTAGIPGLLAALDADLIDCRGQLQLAPPAGEPELQTKARRLQLLARRMSIERESESLRKELLYYTATTDLLPLQVELAQLGIQRGTEALAIYQTELARRQESKLQQQVRAVREEAGRVQAPLTQAAASNLALAEQILARSEQANALADELRELRLKREELDRQYQTAVERYKSVGLTDALGGMLRKQRRDLALAHKQTGAGAIPRDELRACQIELFELQDRMALLRDDAAEAKGMLEAAAVNSPGANPVLVRESETVAARRRHLLEELYATADTRFRNLVALDTEQRQVASRIQTVANWIDERVIWIASAPVLATGDWRQAVSAARWLVHPANWQQVAGELWRDLTTNAIAFLPFLLATLVLFLFRARLKRIIRETGEEASRGRCARILPTFNSLMATVLMSALWPMIIAVLGWTLTHGPVPGGFVSGVGQALLGVAIFMAPLELLRQVCSERGLAAAHFDWPERSRLFLKRTIRSFYFLALPLMLVQGMLESQPDENWLNSLGRVVSCLLFAISAWYLHRVFRPSGTVFQQMALRKPQPGSYRFRVLIHLVALGLPLMLLVLAVMGYFYTARQLGGCLERSLLLLILMVIVGGVLLRWLLMRRRALAMEEARRQRLAMATASESIGPGGEVAAAAITEKTLLDLGTVSRQVREVVVLVLGTVTFAGLWWIWRNVLPAVGILDQLELWQVTVNERVVSVTLKNLFVAFLTAAFSWLMVRNMPGLLNLAVQQFSSLDSGARYAATTIFRYVITVIGAVTALSFLRIQWSQYSWLVAAVTVGLGFGLQEIVANFVSGLILLFERPVRVGDLVTIDNQNGIVTRIQMRATTVMTSDHQELIVPNKDLITGKLLNWSLSNVTNRLVLNVGVAYGTDVDRVQRILLATVTSHPDVLADPPASVSFEEFGDSALLFRIRCFLPNLERRPDIRHELNSAIARAFQAEGIVVPFPQRELLLRREGGTHPNARRDPEAA